MALAEGNAGRNSDGGGDDMLLAREWTGSGGTGGSIGSRNRDESSLNDGISMRSLMWMGIELRLGSQGELRWGMEEIRPRRGWVHMG